jgi:FAD synthase
MSPYNYMILFKRQFLTLHSISIRGDCIFGYEQIRDAQIFEGDINNFGIEVMVILLLIFHGKWVSNSHIRKLLKIGNFDLASLMLDKIR